MKFNSVTEMVKQLSNKKFYFYWLRNKISWLCGYEYGKPEEWFREYQNNAKIYLDEYQSDEPEIETDNFFYERFLRRK